MSLKHIGCFLCYGRGVLLQDRGDMKGADSSYRNAISFRPTLAFAHLNLGIVLRSLKQDGEAEKVRRQHAMHSMASAHFVGVSYKLITSGLCFIADM